MTENAEPVALDKVPVLYSGEVDGESTNPLARYQSSRQVRIVTDRIMALDTVGLSQQQGTLVAQCALANKLNPFPPRPELHYWLSKGYDPIRGQSIIKLNIQEAREATIRNAEMNAKREGLYLHAPRYEHIIDDTQKEQLGFDPTNMVCHARVSDSRQVSDYYDRRAKYQAEGMTFEQIDKRLGEEPDSYEGYGSLTAKELADCKKAKFSAVNKVQKRAYTEALKQKWARLIDLDEMIAGAPADDEDYVIDSEWRLVDDFGNNERTPEQVKKDADEGAATLFDPPPVNNSKPKPWPKDVLEAMVEANVAADADHAAEMLSHSAFDRTVSKTPAIAYAKAYQGAIESGEKPKRAGEIGTAAYLEGLKKRRDST